MFLSCFSELEYEIGMKMEEIAKLQHLLREAVQGEVHHGQNMNFFSRQSINI